MKDSKGNPITEEEFNRILGYENGIDFISFTYSEKEKKLLKLFKSREEKAREEGTKEGFQKGKEWERAMWKNGKVELYENDAITQYKEELLGKLPEEETTTDYEWGSHAEGWNDYREAVIKLL